MTTTSKGMHPIDLPEVWKTQWGAHWQFSFFLLISEATVVITRGYVRDAAAEPVLVFHNKLAIKLMENTINNIGRIVTASVYLLQP